MPLLKKRSAMDLATFVGGIVRALTTGQQALPRARMEQIEKHFTKEDDGLYHPKTTDFKVGDSQTLSVPNYSLAEVNNIGIDSAIIRCSARIVEVEQSDINCEITSHDKQVKYCVVPSSNGNGGKNFEIEIRFSRRTENEAASRILENLNGLIELETIENN